MVSLDLSSLDDSDDTIWNEDGKPRISAVRDLLKDQGITRAMIKETGRGRVRVKPRKPTDDDLPENIAVTNAKSDGLQAAASISVRLEIFDSKGKIRTDFSDAEIAALSPVAQARWAALYAASIAEQEADVALSAALSDISTKIRELASAENRARTIRDGYSDEELSPEDKLALSGNNVVLHEAAQQRAREIDVRNSAAQLRRLEHNRIDEIRRVIRANSNAPIDPEVARAEAKAQAEQAARAADADEIVDVAERNLNAARTRLSAVRDEQRSARAAVAKAVIAWQGLFRPKTHLDLVRELGATTQARAMAIATGALVEPPPAAPASRLDAIMKLGGRRSSTRKFPSAR